VVLAVTAAAARAPDYQLTPGDIRSWEQAHRAIPEGAIVLVKSGWGRFWPDRKAFLGTDVAGDTANLHFPGISREAAEFLASQRRSCPDHCDSIVSPTSIPR
jgi:kynurenine formamidase